MSTIQLPYPPKPVSFLPKEFNPDEWIIQPKYRGWRIIIYNNNIYTRMFRNIGQLDIKTNFNVDFEYVLDGELVSKDFPSTEYKVRKALKENNYKIEIFDIYIFDKPNLTLLERSEILDTFFNIKVSNFEMVDDLEKFVKLLKLAGFEGIVLKKKDSAYKYSPDKPVLDENWVKIK